MPGKLKAEPTTRVVVVGLRLPRGKALPEAAETSRLARSITERLRRAGRGKIEGVQVFPRFGQFSIKADEAAIAAISQQPEVESVMENDSVGL